MNKPFSISALACALSLASPCPVNGFEILSPESGTASFEITSPDDTVETLGKVSFVIDLSAEHDSVFELQIRRKGLLLPDGRPVTTFGYDKAGGVIIGAGLPVTHVSLSGVSGNEAAALFHNANNEVIAPRASDIALFDLNFTPLEFRYKPADPPSVLGMDVSILIDRSGSMDTHMQDVMDAARRFMSGLPDFTRCHVLTFNEQVTHLTPADPQRLRSCPDSLWAINSPVTAGGGTALFAAIEDAFSQTGGVTGRLPHLAIVITDGVNNEPSRLSRDELIDLKGTSKSKLLTFWAGSYDPSHLKGLADVETVSSVDIKGDLDAFFHSIGVSVSGLQTLTIIR